MHWLTLPSSSISGSHIQLALHFFVSLVRQMCVLDPFCLPIHTSYSPSLVSSADSTLNAFKAIAMHVIKIGLSIPQGRAGKLPHASR